MGTTVVPAGDGNMSDYLASLRKLLALDIRMLLPGHGPAVQDAYGKINEYIQHRLMREQQILDCLRQDRHTIAAMVEVIYESYPPALMQVAHRSVEAHLLKLIADQKVRQEGSCYSLID
jgi:glyoxylase-like metal-dependent hydrolase (beta-lactamase superfamily II)